MATEAEIRQWIAGYVRNFNGLCQALMWQTANRFGTVVSTPGSAIAAYRVERDAGRIAQGTPPPGSFVYWDIGADGHVGMMLNGGRIFMGSTKVDEQWSTSNTGPQGLADYNALTGATYLGWSWKNGGNTVPFTPDGDGGGGEINYHWWELSQAAMKALQQAGHRHGTYPTTSPDDGDFGELSVKSTQQILKDLGYLAGDYVVDGKPYDDPDKPSNYGYALQDLAGTAGYFDNGGKRDGLPGSYTSQYLVPAANALFTTPEPPDPEPPVVEIPVLPPAPAGQFFFPDLGTSQGDFDFQEYASKGGKEFAVKMGGSNASDSPYKAPRYDDQMQRAKNAGIQRAIHYWFNGAENGLTPATSADYFAKNARFAEGHVAALDVENEVDKNGVIVTKMWTPDEVVAYITELRKTFAGILGLVYASDSVLDSPEWQKVWDLGWEPWDASWGANNGDPGTPPTTSAPVTAWQYSSVEKVPGGYSGNPKVYYGMDGNLGMNGLFERLGWVAPDPEPEPEPDPELEERVTELEGQVKLLTNVVHTFLAKTAAAADEGAQALE